LLKNALSQEEEDGKADKALRQMEEALALATFGGGKKGEEKERKGHYGDVR